MKRLHWTVALGLLGLTLAGGCQPADACRTDADCGSEALTCNTGTCVPRHVTPKSVGGTLQGLAPGGSLVLQNNGRSDLTLTADGPFVFSLQLVEGATYQVTVKSQPADQTCTVANGSGTVGNGNVLDVSVTCSGEPRSVGGTVTGLVAGRSVVLSNNDTELLTVSANGPFTFEAPVLSGQPYLVAVKTQPAGMVCSVSNGSGTVGTNITSVLVTCSTRAFRLGGSVSGLAAGGSLVLTSNDDELRVDANGAFAFPSVVAEGTPYAVTVKTQPTGQECVVTNGSGTMGGGDVTNVLVSCSATLHSVGGSVQGLAAGGSLVLTNNDADVLSIQANGAFTFSTPVAYRSTYAVAVKTQPTGQTCTVSAAAGTVTGNVADVAVACSNNHYSLGGSVSGLRAGASLTLTSSGTQPLVVSANGPFVFSTQLAYGEAYTVTVSSQPEGQTCTLTNPTGTMGAANVTDVAVTCVTSQYLVGGTVAGLAPGHSLVLTNDGGDDLTVGGSGPFTFATAVAHGGRYAVAVKTQPTGQTCAVSEGAGIVTGNVTSVAVACSNNLYALRATVMGLASGESVVLQNNGGDDLTVATNTTASFATQVAYLAPYNVTVKTHPATMLCSVVSGSGTMGTSDVTVGVTCSNNVFRVGGTVSGLRDGASLTLTNNGEDHTVFFEGAFEFPTSLANGTPYAVTVKLQPQGQTCTVANGTGTLSGADVTNVAVTCETHRYSVGGTVAGLPAGGTLVLTNNGTDELSVSADGTFVFPTQVAWGMPYAVAVKAQPVTYTCSVAGGSGTMGEASVTDVAITCVRTGFWVGGTVTGLRGGATLVLTNNGTDDLSVTTDGAFTFSTFSADGNAYAVTVKTQPGGNQECAVTNGSGTVTGADVTSVAVTCACVSGFADDGTGVCVDVDECATGALTCSDNATCQNTSGSASCSCNGGYGGDGQSCTRLPYLASAAGSTQSCAIAQDKTLWCWGANANGQVGDGTTAPRYAPVRVGQESNWATVSAAADHTCGVRTDGTLWCWGLNTKSQLGDGSTTRRLSPVQVGTDTTWASVSTGQTFTCAVKTDSTLWCWGDNAKGQQGNGTSGATLVAAPELVGTGWASVSAGAAFVCGRKTDDSVWCWGDNAKGQVGTGTAGAAPVTTPFQVSPSAGNTWTSVSAGNEHACGRQTNGTNGTLWCWGSNASGQLAKSAGTLTMSPSPIQVGTLATWTAVDPGGNHTCAAQQDKSLWCWGNNVFGQFGNGLFGAANSSSLPKQVLGGLQWEQLAVGTNHACAVDSQGALLCWGDNSGGQLGDLGVQRSAPVQVTDVGNAPGRVLGAGWNHTCATKPDGTLWCWGRNNSGALGDNTVLQKESPVSVVNGPTGTWSTVAGGQYHSCGLLQDGRLYCWGEGDLGRLGLGSTTDQKVPVQVAAGTTWSALGVGQSHACAVKSDNTLWCWGAGGSGRLGNGGTADKSVPDAVSGGATWSAVGAGQNHSCAIQASPNAGTLWCWGANGVGQLGDSAAGSTQVTPVQESTQQTWSSLSLGAFHTCAIRNDGSLWCWGNNPSGQLGYATASTTSSRTPTQVSPSTTWTSVAAGESHTCGTQTNGTLWCWGDGEHGQTADASLKSVSAPRQVGAETDWAKVISGYSSTCALKQDGSMWCWGLGIYGQLGIGKGTVLSATPSLTVQ